MRIVTVFTGMLMAATVVGSVSPAHAEDVWRPAPLNWTWPDRNLRDVEPVGANEAWAAGGQGKVYVGIPGDLGRPPITLLDIGAKPLLQQWTGTSWKSHSPPGISGEGEITDVEAVTSDNVWASGFVGYRNRTAYLAHWDGAKWSQVTSPSTLVSAEMWADAKGLWLRDRTALHRFAGGTWTRHSLGGRHINFVQQTANGDLHVFNEDKISHWNGSSWTTFERLPGDVHHSPDHYYAATAEGMWAVSRTGSDDSLPIVHRWTGTAWEAVPVPDAYRGTWYHSIYDLEGPVIQFRKQNSTIHHQLRWNGTSWDELSKPATSIPANPVVAGDGTYWAAGNSTLYRLEGTTWTAVQVPIAGYLKVAPIPGSRHLFAWGESQNGDLSATTNAP
ncbi:hypothetical protein [Actinomadura rudentiformis]|uniref:Carbohydrate-binding protein n=1 Tax=Actinomadura rudentiformis TaxID=359158 RepID=A0A6H9YL38_9ACTN|nr:hypothetical protein [Actinomadura rudentiformis]KAB2342492.1 hypothetical protein F8566_38805 [Actinomadura rudentiformis]